MANKNNDPIYALAEQIVGSSEKLAESKVDKAQYDKSFAVSILGVNQKFVGDVSAEEQQTLIEKYSIPSTIEEGDPNYYTIQINGAYYISKQNGNFKLYDKVMAYLPNGDWSRMYLDYPVNYTESVTLHVFTQAEEPEDGMEINDLWFELDEDENIIALYHYGLNEETEENEWIFDGKVETIGSGTGKWLDEAHTSVAHNDWEHNTSTLLYDSINGYNNSSSRVLYPAETKGGNLMTGWNNVLIDGTAAFVYGMGNTVERCAQSEIGGRDNTGYQVTYSTVNGQNNDITNIADSAVFGEGHTISELWAGFVSGRNHTIHPYNEAAFSGLAVFGDGATITTADRYKFVIGRNGNIFTVDINGNVTASGTITPGGADWAETYEWLDGNPDNEDRRGLFVTLDGKYIKLATESDDYILGAISATPSICGDTYDLHWRGKYKKDVFGAIQTDKDDVPILADDFNSELKYVPQSSRREKAKVGIQGKLIVVDDGTCVVNKYCKPSVGGIGTYTDDKNYYRVIERLDDTHIKIVIK